MGENGIGAVSRVISNNDHMALGVGVDQCLGGGKIALDLCTKILAGRTPERILDFPSGHGRVMRWFRHQWPKADLYAVEVDADALDFREREFDAKKIISCPEIESLELPSDVELIWSGSLLTRFNWHMWESFCLAVLRVYDRVVH